MILSKNQISRLVKDYSKIAGEPVTIEQIKSGLYVFGSELATLRIFRKQPLNTRQGYSENLNTFYFSTELIFAESAEDQVKLMVEMLNPTETPVTNCDHIPGKFYGHSLSKYHENYVCGKCGQVYSIHITNR